MDGQQNKDADQLAAWPNVWHLFVPVWLANIKPLEENKPAQAILQINDITLLHSASMHECVHPPVPKFVHKYLIGTMILL